MVLGLSKLKEVIVPSPYLVKLRTDPAYAHHLLCKLSSLDYFSPVVVDPQRPSEQARIKDLQSQFLDLYKRMTTLGDILDIEFVDSPLSADDCSSLLPLDTFAQTVLSFLSNYEQEILSSYDKMIDLENSIDLFSSLSDLFLNLDLDTNDLFNAKSHTFVVIGTIPSSYEELIKFYLSELTRDSYIYWSSASPNNPRFKTIFILSMLEFKDQIMHILEENYYKPIDFTETSLSLLNKLKEEKNSDAIVQQLSFEIDSLKTKLYSFKTSIEDKLTRYFQLVLHAFEILNLETKSRTLEDSFTIWGWVAKKRYSEFEELLGSFSFALQHSLITDYPFKYRKQSQPSTLPEIKTPKPAKTTPSAEEHVPELSERGRHAKSYPLFPEKAIFVKFEVPEDLRRLLISEILSLGVVHPVKMGTATEARSTDLLHRKTEFESYRSRIGQLLTRLDIKNTKAVSTLANTQKISIVDNYEHSKAFILNLLNDYENKILELDSKKQQLQQKINQLRFYLPFEDMFSEFGLKLNFLESGMHTFVLLGSIPARHHSAVSFFLREVTDNNALFWFSDSENIDGDDRKNIFLVSLFDYKEQILRVLNEYNFNPIDLSSFDFKRIMNTSYTINSLEKDLEKITQQIAELKSSVAFKLLAAKELIESELSRIQLEEQGQIIDDKFTIWGWIPEKQQKDVESLKTIFGNSLSITYNPDAPLVSPSITKKSKTLGVFRGLVDGLGVPSTHEVDPYFFIRFTFPILFAIMFADVAHGLMLVLIGLFLTYRKKKKNIQPDESLSGYLYKGSGLIIYTGLAAMIMGLLFGAFLGDEELLPELYASIGVHWLPIILSPLHQVKTLLTFSLIVGFILMQFTIWLRILQNVRYGHGKSDVLAPTFLSIFYVGLFAILYNLISKNTPWHIGAVHTENGAIEAYKTVIFPAIPPEILNVLVIITLISLVLVFLTEYFHKKAEGIMEAIDHVLALLSNTLSFSRLMALLLVHGILASIPFNIINGLEPLSVGWWVAGLLIGILIIVPLEGLLSFLNSLRLHWVELFNKFYVGDGIPYNPVSLSLSYIIFERPLEG